LSKASRVTRALVSVVFSVLVILFFYGYLAPYGLDPNAILGSQYAALLGSGALMAGATSGPASLIAPFIPGGATGLIVYTLMKRVGGVSRSLMAPSGPSTDEIMKKMNIDGMMTQMNSMSAIGGAMGPAVNLPADITRSQFTILRGYRRGMKSPQDIADALSMEKSGVEAETSALIASGYLSKDLKVSIKGMELLGS
jgi:hypothetical protein